MDMLADGLAWYAGQIKSYATQSVQYFRGTNFAVLKASVGQSQFQTQNTSGIIESWETRDYTCLTSDLPFGEPRRGDYIVETRNGISTQYEVSSPSGLPLFRYGDAFRNTVRIHTVAAAASTPVSAIVLVRCCGAFAGETITDNQIIDNLSIDLGGTRQQERSITCVTQYVYVLLPASFGTPTFKVNGLTNSAWVTSTRNIAFAGQASRSYVIHRSAYQITATISLQVA